MIKASKTNVVPLRPGQLLNYDAACQALAKAVTVDDVKGILDLAERAKIYAKQAEDPQAIRDAIALRERGEYELGMILKAQAKVVGMAKGGAHQHKANRVNRKPDSPPTLSEVGIKKNLAHRARKQASVPKALEKIEKRRQGIYPAPKPRRVMMHDVVDVSDDPGLSFDYDIEQAMRAAKDEREGLVVTDDVIAKIRAVIDAWKQRLKKLEESHGQKVP